MRPHIIVDVDDVCADMLSVWLERYNQDYNDSLTKESITAWEMIQFVKPECGNKIYRYLDDPNLYDEVKPIPSALWGVSMLNAGAEPKRVLFVTANVHLGKLRWLQKWGFLGKSIDSESRFICCRNKSLIRANYIIDDNIKTVASFPGFGILFDQPHNRSDHRNFRANGWGEVVDYLRNMNAI